jgi:Spy/CpxP family protein refolding chaperone
MKQIRILLGMAVLLLLPVLYFTGCSEKGEVNSPNELNFESAQFAVIDFTDAENSVEDGTIETPIAINSVLSSYSFLNMGGGFTAGGPMMKGNPWLERFDFGKHLGLFFRRLKLTDEQKVALKNLMVNFHETMKPLVKEFLDANKDIITKANADRKTIVDQVRDSTLTRAEAAVKLKALNEATRDAIKNNPKTVEVKTKMCAARTQLFADIKGILEGDQVTKFENLIKLIKNPC